MAIDIVGVLTDQCALKQALVIKEKDTTPPPPPQKK